MPRLHDLLVVLLVGLRPLVWDGDPAAPANLVYLALTIGAGFLVLMDLARGQALRWSGTATMVAIAILALLPACAMAPVPPEGRAYAIQLLLTGLLGWYLLQVLPGRGGLIQAALLGGLAVEALLALGQPLWVLPAMAQANQSGSLAPVLGDIPSADLAERIDRGGVFGTFTLSNLLASWLLLAVPVAAGAVAAGGAPLARGVALMVALAGALAFATTSSKGAWLVAALVAVATVAWIRRAWWLLGLVPLGAVAVALAPGVPAALQASAQVRWEYWQGAATLWWSAPWTGLGWGAFAQAYPSVMPVAAEPTRLVHQALLEVAVAGGVLVALLWAAAGVALVHPLLRFRPRPLALAPDAGPGPSPSPSVTDSANPPGGSGTLAGGWIVTILAFAVAYGALLGGLDGNLGWWPGGGGLAVLPWGLVLGTVLGLVVVATRTLPVASRTWLLPALAAILLHAQTDLTTHSFACLGTIAVVAVLAGQGGRPLPGRWPVPVALVLHLLVAAALVLWAALAIRQRDAADRTALLGLIARGDPAAVNDAFTMLAGAPVPPADRPRVLADVIAALHHDAGDDHPLVLRLLLTRPPSAERLAALDALAVHLPDHAGLALARAADLLALHRPDDAIAAARQAVSKAPANLPLRRSLADVLEQAARQNPAQAPIWWAERAAVLTEVDRLKPVVHPKNR